MPHDDTPTVLGRMSAASLKAIIVDYLSGVTVQDLCDNYGLTRTQLAKALDGVRRRQDAEPTLEDLANLYVLLHAAQLEIESLRQQLEAGS